MKWEPIETAPMNGTDVLLRRQYGPPIVAAFLRGEWQDFDSAREISGVPTHWAPLPAEMTKQATTERDMIIDHFNSVLKAAGSSVRVG